MNEVEYSQFKDFLHKLIYDIMTIEDYELIMRRLGVPNPIKTSSDWRYKTLCHNIDVNKCGNNLSFRVEERNFYCFSDCNCSYNIITLLEKRFNLIGEKKTRFQCVKWICEQLNIPFDFKEEIKQSNVERYNWQESLGKYIKNKNNISELKVYDKNILNGFEKLYHQKWIDDNISIEVMEQYGIRYYLAHDSIVIPCLDKNGQLVGIRERFINPNSDFKYLPLQLLDGTSFKFPVNQTLYGLNYNAQNINHYKKIVIGEAEKFTLQCATYFGQKNYSVSLYGHAMSNSKLKQIIELGVEEVVIGIDFDYEEVGDNKDFNRFKDNVYRIGDYFKGFCKVSAMISYEGHNIKDSPTDHGKEWYKQLYENREGLY